MNNVTLIGNLGDRVEMRQGNGEPVATFRVATNKRWKDREGNQKDSVTWHTVVCFGWVARAVDGITKGTRVIVIGEAVERTYQHQDGSTRYVHEVRAQFVALVCMDPNPPSK